MKCTCGNPRYFGPLLSLAVIGALTGMARADALSDAVNNASLGLRNSQDGTNHNWTGVGATGYNGTIVSGLVSAYHTGGLSLNMNAAKSGASAIINDVNTNQGGVYLGDEVYSLVQVAGLPGSPVTYQNEALNFFNNTIPGVYVNNHTFINSLLTSYGQDKTQPTVYLAYYTLAAYGLGTLSPTTKADFRQGLIDTLGKVADQKSDSSGPQWIPTGALGAAVWALAQTGGFPHTPITGPSVGQNVFGGHYLDELPGMLDARFDHGTNSFDYNLLGPSPYDGATEATAFGILGLDAYDCLGSHAYDSDVAAARLALAGAVNTGTPGPANTGETSAYVNFANVSPTAVYAGRALEALAVPEPASVGMLAFAAVGLLVRRRKSN